MLTRRGLLAASALAAPGLASAAWPERPVRLVVGFPPGGPTDFIARSVAPGLSAAWGQPVVIENRGGANATIATELVARAAPDGTTLLLAANNHVMNPPLYARLPYDPGPQMPVNVDVRPPAPPAPIADPRMPRYRGTY